MNHISSIFFFPYGRGDLGRTPTFSQTDLLVQHSFQLKGTELNLNMNVQNLFDQDTATGYYTTPYRDNINVPYPDFFRGFDPVAYATANNLRPDARYSQESAFQNRRIIRLQARITF